LDERPWYDGFFDAELVLGEVANTLAELEAMLGRAGLELRGVHGDLEGGPLELGSSFLVTLSGRAGSRIS
jgi:hypothetical protein